MIIKLAKHTVAKVHQQHSDYRRQILRGAVVLVAGALAGYLALTATSAATFITGSEAEAGTLAGNASTTNDPGASGSTTVRFGGTVPSAPTDVTAITGGNSVAIRWSPSAVAGTTIQQYKILRNGTQIGTVDPGAFNPDYPEKNGCGFVDKAITKGTTYSYQIQAVSALGTPSAISQSISVKPPTNTTPVPTITVDSTGAPQFDSFVRNTVAPFLQIWYPKVSDRVAYPDYTPSLTETLKFDTSLTGTGHLAETDPDLAQIRVDPGWLQGVYNNPAISDRGLALYLHESSHVIQGDPANHRYSQGKWYAIEGGADFPLEYIANTRPPTIPSGADNYNDGYGAGAWFLQQIIQKYDSNYLRKITVDGHNQALTASDTYFSDGKNLDELWSQFRGLPSSTGAFTSKNSNKCIDADGSGVASGTKLQIWDCSSGKQNQKITAWPNQNTTVDIHMLSNCFDVANSGTTNGTAVRLWDCNHSNAQKWVVRADGSIFNPNSGKCLEVINSGNSGANGSSLEIWDCNGGSWQKWSLPANTPSAVTGQIAFRSSTSKCLDDPSGSTTDGTQQQVYDCNGQAPQQWTLMKRSDGVTKLTVLGKCLDISNFNAANGTKVQIYSCNNSGAQNWQPQANGTLKNPGTGKCLDTNTKTIANSALMVINDCNASASQVFNFPS